MIFLNSLLKGLIALNVEFFVIFYLKSLCQLDLTVLVVYLDVAAAVADA